MTERETGRPRAAMKRLRSIADQIGLGFGLAVGAALVLLLLQGQILTSAVPSGALLLRNGACPAGYTELTAAQGRFLVGTPSGGTQGGTLGTAVTDLADASVTPTGTNGTAAFTPAGTNGTVTVATTSASLAGAGAGAFGTIATVSPGSSFTVGAQTFTGSAGTVPAQTFTGTANTTMRSTVSPYIQLRVCQAP